MSVTLFAPCMNSELTSHDPFDCCLFLACVRCYQVPGMSLCYVSCVKWCGGACCVVRGVPFSCASLPAELWPLSNLPGKSFPRMIGSVGCG